MGIFFGSLLGILMSIVTVLLHLALVAIIVVLFVMYLNTKKKSILTAIILLGILLAVMLLSYPVILLIGWLGIIA